jgi:hypothetical protein
VGPGVYFAPTLAGKRCISEPAPINLKCHITMQQCRDLGRGTGNAGKWEALTQGTQGEKTENPVTPYLLQISARFFALRGAGYLNASNET